MKPRKMIALITVIILPIIGCGRPYSKPDVAPDSKFKGLSDYDSSRLIMVHGMCHHTKKWFEENVDSVKKAYNLEGGIIENIQFNNGYGAELYTSELYNNKSSVRLYGIIYSGVTKELKRKALCANVSVPNEVCSGVDKLYDKKQASINKTLKNELMNNCLADAVIYLGKAGNKIRSGISSALVSAFKHSSSTSKYKNKPTFYYSESLGSKILGDSIVCAKNEEKKLFNEEMGLTTNFIMAANQIPLLNLGNNRVPCRDSSVIKEKSNIDRTIYYDLFQLITMSKKLNKNKESLIAVSTPITVLSLTDPNDILSYELSTADVGQVDLVNITVSNSPTLFGLFEHPLKAHTTYDKNCDFIKYLWEGNNNKDSHS